MQPGKLRGIDRLADEHGHLRMLAIDQRPPLIDLVTRAGSADVARDVASLKAMVVYALQPHASAVLIDPAVALGLSGELDPAAGLLLTLEDHRFTETPGGRMSSTIPRWTVERIKSMGADAVKLLAWYRPDVSAGVRRHQEDFVQSVGEACRRLDIAFVLELLTYPRTGPGRGAPTVAPSRAEVVLQSVEHFAAPRFAVDLFKVENPFDADDLPPRADDDGAHRRVFTELDRLIDRPWVLLSGGHDRAAFVRALEYACDAGASGFLAGRSIWWNAVARFPELDAIERGLHEDAVPFMAHLASLVKESAPAWNTRTRGLGASRVGAPSDIGAR